MCSSDLREHVHGPRKVAAAVHEEQRRVGFPAPFVDGEFHTVGVVTASAVGCLCPGECAGLCGGGHRRKRLGETVPGPIMGEKVNGHT